jgi:hypothetical protein
MVCPQGKNTCISQANISIMSQIGYFTSFSEKYPPGTKFFFTKLGKCAIIYG